MSASHNRYLTFYERNIQLSSNKICNEFYLVKRISGNFIPHLRTNDNWNVGIGMEAWNTVGLKWNTYTHKAITETKSLERNSNSSPLIDLVGTQVQFQWKYTLCMVMPVQ